MIKHKKTKQSLRIGKMIKRITLLKLYKIIKSEPKKNWKASDFSSKGYFYNTKTYLQTLLELGLIKRTNINYDKWNWYKGKRTVCGFKLKK